MGDRLRVDYAAVEGLIGDMKGYEGNIEDLYSDMTTTNSRFSCQQWLYGGRVCDCVCRGIQKYAWTRY